MAVAQKSSKTGGKYSRKKNASKTDRIEEKKTGFFQLFLRRLIFVGIVLAMMLLVYATTSDDKSLLFQDAPTSTKTDAPPRDWVIAENSPGSRTWRSEKRASSEVFREVSNDGETEESNQASNSSDSTSESESNDRNSEYGASGNDANGGNSEYGATGNDANGGNSEYGATGNDANSGSSQFGATGNDANSGSSQYGTTGNDANEGSSEYGTTGNDANEGSSEYGTTGNDVNSGGSQFGATGNDANSGSSQYGTTGNDANSGSSQYGAAGNDANSGSSQFGATGNDANGGNSEYGASGSDANEGSSQYGTTGNDASNGNVNSGSSGSIGVDSSISKLSSSDSTDYPTSDPLAQTSSKPKLNQNTAITGPDGNPRFGEIPILEQSSQQSFKTPVGPPISDFLEIFNFDVTPDWVEAHWSCVTLVGPLSTRGYRVPISTGPTPSDLVGSLTYYFNSRLELEKITFEGFTGNLERLIISLKYFQMSKRITSDPNAILYLSETLENGQRSFLKTYFRIFPKDENPNKKYWITMELYPPEVH